MNTKKLLVKILYSITFAAIFMAPVKAFAVETVVAKEVMTKAEKAALKSEPAKQYKFVQNYLGEEEYNRTIDPDRPEMRIRNPFERFKRKKNLQPHVQPDSKPIIIEEEENSAMKIYCSEMEYFEERNELEARGGVEIITEGDTKANADLAIYNKDSNTIKLIDNVVITKSGSTVTGDYILIDLNEENALMDEPVTRMGNIEISAKEGYAYSDRIENINGEVGFGGRVEMELYTQGFSRYGRSINDTRLVDFELKKQRSKPYKFKTKEIVIRPEKDHDSMLMKDVDVYYKNRKILKVPSIEYFQDKERTRSEVNFPLEIGSMKGLGMYAGLGYTFKLPKTYTFRVTPTVVYGESELGAGVMAQLKSARSRFEAGWASSTNNLIFDGQVKLTKKLDLELGRHVYKSEWFNGGTRAGYIAELAYDDSYVVKDLDNATFRHRFSAGYVADYRRKHQEKNMRDGFRYRYQAQLSKSIKTIGSIEQDMYVKLYGVAQASATVYSETGDTTALFRVGPAIQSRVKRWNSNIMGTLGGVHCRSPYWFDEYRYGRQTVSFDESLIMSRFLSVGYRGTLTPLKDNRKNDILTENRFYAVAGPEDFKIAFSYDTIRQNMYVDFLFLLGSDNLGVKYDKMTINNPEKLGRRTKKQSDKELYKVKIPENL